MALPIPNQNKHRDLLISSIRTRRRARTAKYVVIHAIVSASFTLFFQLFNLLTVALYVSAAAVPLTTGGILTTDVSTAVALGWITISMLCQRWRGFCASSLPPFLHACSFVAAFTDLLLLIDGLASYRIIPHEHQNQGDWETTLRSLVIFGALGSFLCACFRSSPVLDKATSKINTAADEETFSPCGRLVGLAAITHIINSVRHSKIIEDNIRPTIRRLKCRLLVKRLYSPAERNWCARYNGEIGKEILQTRRTSTSANYSRMNWKSSTSCLFWRHPR